MDKTAILYPVFAMVVLTIGVWVCLYRQRVGEIRQKRMNPQILATRASASAQLSNTTAADNFSNLFEVPVLFYVLAALIYVGDDVSAGLLSLAWLFVVMRYLHSFIHVGYNKVMHRFLVYVLSTTVLWLMWIVFAVEAVSRVID